MTMLLATATACCLASATGLRFVSQEPGEKPVGMDQTIEARSCENGTARSEVRAAMCVAGNARTFPEPDVVGSLRGLLRKVEGDSHSCAKQRVDLFAYITLTGDRREVDEAGFPQVNATKQAVEEALRKLNATAFQTVETEAEITMKNYKQHVVGEECFKGGFWHRTSRLVRSLNHLRHVQLCLRQVIQQEAQQGQAYDTVIVTRPDFSYNDRDDWGMLVVNTAAEQLIHHQQDFFLAMPRAVMNAFFDPNRSMPLTCHHGEFCCGKVHRSEDMFEYIMEAHLMGDPCPSRGCYCSKNFTATHRSHYVRAGGIARANRLSPRRPKPLRQRYGQNATVQNGTKQPAIEFDKAELCDGEEDEELDEAELDDDEVGEDPDEEQDEESGF